MKSVLLTVVMLIAAKVSIKVGRTADEMVEQTVDWKASKQVVWKAGKLVKFEDA